MDRPTRRKDFRDADLWITSAVPLHRHKLRGFNEPSKLVQRLAVEVAGFGREGPLTRKRCRDTFISLALLPSFQIVAAAPATAELSEVFSPKSVKLKRRRGHFH